MNKLKPKIINLQVTSAIHVPFIEYLNFERKNRKTYKLYYGRLHIFNYVCNYN
jgi:hypothetical protein